MQRKSLKDARRLFRQRRFAEVIRILEPEVFRFRESFDFYFLLGSACLRSGDLGGAFSYLKRADHLKQGDENVLLSLAAIHFKKTETEEALQLWLEVLESQPGNAVAKRGMAIMRKGLTPERYQDFIASGKLKTILPPLPPKVSALPVLILVALLLAATSLGYLFSRAIASEKEKRPGVASVEVPAELPRLTDSESGYRYKLSEKAVNMSFSRAKRYLLQYQDNLALVEINRLLLSNASSFVKEKARLLKSFVKTPDFTTLRDSFTYQEVVREPYLYADCFVRWKGKVANLSIGKEAITFDLLVGYHDEKKLEGIVPTILDFAATLEDGSPLEVLGVVVLQNGRVTLKVVSLHKLFPQA